MFRAYPCLLVSNKSALAESSKVNDHSLIANCQENAERNEHLLDSATKLFQLIMSERGKGENA